VGGSTPVRARMASACSGGGARRAARGARRAFGASGMQHLSPHPHATPFGLWGGARLLGWGEAMRCGGPAREGRAGPKCAGMLG